MGSKRSGVVAAVFGLVAIGMVGALAWRQHFWALLAASIVGIGWLCGRLLRRTQLDGRSAPERAAQPAFPDALPPGLLLEAAPTPMVAVDGSVVRALNRAARRLFSTGDRLMPAPQELLDPAIDRFRHRGRVWRLDRVALLASTPGKMIIAIVDIEQEARLAEARAATEFIHLLGHELLNGLVPIVSLADSGMAAISASPPDLPLLQEILGTLARRADGLQRFAEGYRALSRLPDPRPRPVVLGQLIGDISRLFSSKWPTIALRIDIDPEAVCIADRDQLTQALWALLQNAAEAISAIAPSGRVTLSAVAGADGATFDIEDDGPGLGPDDASRIFHPFQTTKAEGTGLGLSLAQQIAHAHGGHISVRSTTPAVFRIVLPISRDPLATGLAMNHSPVATVFGH